MVDPLWLTLCSYFATALGFDTQIIQLNDTWSFLRLFAIFLCGIEETGHSHFSRNLHLLTSSTIYIACRVFLALKWRAYEYFPVGHPRRSGVTLKLFVRADAVFDRIHSSLMSSLKVGESEANDQLKRSSWSSINFIKMVQFLQNSDYEQSLFLLRVSQGKRRSERARNRPPRWNVTRESWATIVHPWVERETARALFRISHRRTCRRFKFLFVDSTIPSLNFIARETGPRLNLGSLFFLSREQ